jgi:predicted transposase/invertase (TIGR01784 family)
LIARFEKAISDGSEINEFEVLLIPLCEDDREALDVLKEACKLVIKSGKDKDWVIDLLTSLILISNKIVDSDKLLELRKEFMDMGIPIADAIKKEGYDEGRNDGRNEGRNEGVRLTAINFIKAGVDDVIVSQASNLSLEEIKKIKAEIAAEASAKA